MPPISNVSAIFNAGPFKKGPFKNESILLSIKDENPISLGLVNQSLLTFYPFPAII